MKLKLIPFLLLLCLQTIAQDERKLAETFILSLTKNNYNLLAPHIATPDIINNALYAGKANKAKLTKDFTVYTTKLKTAWPQYIVNAKTEGINLSKIEILNVSAEVINKEANMHGLNIMYKHADRFGMIGMIYFPYNKKAYLLDLPNPLSAFTSKDSFSIATNLQYNQDKNDPLIEAVIQEELNMLFGYVKDINITAFTSHTVHRDDDPSKNWKIAGDPANKYDSLQAGATMGKIHLILEGCPDKKFESFKIEKESEGVWYVYSYQCLDGKIIHFAFLKIQGKYLLGDINVEKP
ncbi:hypothetical protein LK994_06975 [Ferruginibacter lapsinanis]|uniref:hypothetical protein n=1 Tax=Ferruginibacter lapsinanis TaxID=563172 RepID=UPI001E357D12|nr:hypothetical protein [Ferruginibacter lapsinanis]UEG51214.1 hypothetical protein LK994_06975 [Ferruginibacter lapsinanis]